MEITSCPGAGACQGLYTANTMACLTEVMGMSLPGCATSLAVSAKTKRIAFDSGVLINELIEKDIHTLGPSHTCSINQNAPSWIR